MPSIENAILAVVTLHPEQVAGGLPVFAVPDDTSAQKLAGSLSHILDAQVHDLQNGTLIIVRH
ncbi:MAG: capping complex subunit for YIEGIA [Bacillota bacterium]